MPSFWLKQTPASLRQPDAKPIRAKVRKLLPGSPKEKMAKEAWFELLKLGIIERVNASDCNTFSSALHFAPKADGSLRPVGDYRPLNEITELELHHCNYITVLL